MDQYSNCICIPFKGGNFKLKTMIKGEIEGEIIAEDRGIDGLHKEGNPIAPWCLKRGSE